MELERLEDYVERVMKYESTGGILLMLAAVLALIVSNTDFKTWYDLLLDTPVEVRVGEIKIAKPLLLWINDGLMAIFFFVIGLELKRELLEGELSDTRNIILPGIGAAGGMLVPALIYIWFNAGDADALKGWAIPAATDIAFALGILSLLGTRVPVSLKVFLTSLAIFDDMGAITIIAFFYTEHLAVSSLAVVAACLPILFMLNKSGTESKSIYLIIGIIMWVAMLKSGVHATLTGVITAAFVPMYSRTHPRYSPLKILERDLHNLVAFFVLPVFAFTNAGLNLSGIGLHQLFHPVPFGIATGLFVGKLVGVFGFCWLAVKMGLVQYPKGMNTLRLLGTAALCGVGFTMSMFVGSLAFEESGVNLLFDERLGIITGSLLSGILGYLLLNWSLPRPEAAARTAVASAPRMSA